MAEEVGAITVSQADLHRILDELRDSELHAAQQFLEYLRISGRDPMLQALRAVPEDDELSTPEEDGGADEARQEYRRGEFVTAEEAKQLLRP